MSCEKCESQCVSCRDPSLPTQKWSDAGGQVTPPPKNKDENGWISVKDKLPEIQDNGTSCRVLLWTSLCDTPDDTEMGVFTRSGQWLTFTELEPDEVVTHWMDCPQPPTEK